MFAERLPTPVEKMVGWLAQGHRRPPRGDQQRGGSWHRVLVARDLQHRLFDPLRPVDHPFTRFAWPRVVAYRTQPHPIAHCWPHVVTCGAQGTRVFAGLRPGGVRHGTQSRLTTYRWKHVVADGARVSADLRPRVVVRPVETRCFADGCGQQ